MCVYIICINILLSYIYIYIYMCIHMYIIIFLYLCIYKLICVCIYMCMYVYIYMYICQPSPANQPAHIYICIIQSEAKLRPQHRVIIQPAQPTQPAHIYLYIYIYFKKRSKAAYLLPRMCLYTPLGGQSSLELLPVYLIPLPLLPSGRLELGRD